MSRTLALEPGGKRLSRATKHGPPPPHADLPVGTTKQSWREHALTRIQELQDYVGQLESSGELTNGTAKRVGRHLRTAQDAAQASHRVSWYSKPVAVERVMTHIDAAEAALLKSAPREDVTAQVPNVLSHVRKHLPCDSPDRESAERIAETIRSSNHGRVLTAREQSMLVSAFRSASLEERRAIMQVRSLRSVLYVAFALTSGLVIALGLLGAVFHQSVGLCFYPGGPAGRVVCPLGEADLVTRGARAVVTAQTTTPGDVPVVLVLGMSAAALAAAVALRQVKGSSTPFSLPVALALLKLPTGALTALLGILLMSGQFMPGLSALDSPTQILAWAIIFGYSQQVVTRLIDQRAQTTLDSVGRARSKAKAR